ncbi:DNA-binding response OmpR family regulator [Sphingomonas zeicaulis]|uniref:response regulator n=1 Tax=Sphingomonas zeicaulis TaxID=1632740 RepID=UPI003D1E9110
MTEHLLDGRRILVVEDEYMLAAELRTALMEVNAVVLGPVGTVDATLDLLRSDPHVDGAILDVNLHGEPVYPAADELVARGVPFVFATGYDASVIPKRFAHVLSCDKPINIKKIVQAIGGSARAD